MSSLLEDASQRANRYQTELDNRPVFPTPSALANLSHFDEPFPAVSQPAAETLHLLDTYGSPATVASSGQRYFGFVTGGALPVTLAANWLAGAWDQNGALFTTSPIAAKLEEVALGWLCDLFQLPSTCAGAFVTGATLANFTALAAARHHLLARLGWDVEAHGLFGAPPLQLVVSDEVHVSVLKALSLLGFGRERVFRVPVDKQGRINLAHLPQLTPETIVCVQMGNVNSGSFDPVQQICEQAQTVGAWVHVDGAFGLWAAVSPALHHLTAGLQMADSWATDAHKWLNVPYDCGIALCKHPQALQAAMSTSAAYLTTSAHRDPAHYGPEFSRRARGIEVWAALRTLGQAGLAHLVEENCRLARLLAQLLQTAGFMVHNEVVLNQVVISLGSPELTNPFITTLQQEGTLWAGKTIWQGHQALRLSVSSWATTETDIIRTAQTLIHLAQPYLSVADH